MCVHHQENFDYCLKINCHKEQKNKFLNELLKKKK